MEKIKDITEIPMHDLLLSETADEKAMLNLKKFTDARIGIGRTGTRYKTLPYLGGKGTFRFRISIITAKRGIVKLLPRKLRDKFYFSLLFPPCFII